ncbi:AAA family ATPase [Streptomyces sp. NBC_00829]|uniref:AAA family ATPase n=1 Tax=Streptomyces sp. NBC_00829 TaxID=2903679 RepID=UPI003867B00F|nr:AAA family ATPase [Streptomyces sp. NBC_00829]WTB19092.1 AAA family ATPase [Streptomyces sp. NBC_00829]
MVDVLIITALPLEFEAAHYAGLASTAGEVGISWWEEIAPDTNAPYELGNYVCPDGVSLTVALAQSDRMGGLATGPLASELAAQLKPRCLAMSGVCAGEPRKTAPGDVVVANMAYAWDEGKQTVQEFLGDHHHQPQQIKLIRAARRLDAGQLPSFADATDEGAKLWFLELLLIGQNPRKHAARERYFPPGTWKPRLAAFQRENLITLEDTGYTLTDHGRSYIRRTIEEDAEGPDRLPLGIVVGPMASGRAVIEDPGIWRQLSQMGVRKITGLEMEAADIVRVAEQQEIPFWLVAKGVMDHADPSRDDRYKDFAAKASAEALYALLGNLAGTITDRRTEGGAAPTVLDWRTRLRKQGLLAWPAELFAAGTAETDAADNASPDAEPDGNLHPHDAPLQQGEAVDAGALGAGRLPNLQLQFESLGRKFDNWKKPVHREPDENWVQIFWIVGEPGPHRSKALLAMVSRARNLPDPRAVYDPGRNLDLAAEAIAELGHAKLPEWPALIPVDLPSHQERSSWSKLRAVLDGIHRDEHPQKTPHPVLVIGGTAAQAQDAYDILQTSIRTAPFTANGLPQARPDSHTGTENMATRSLPAEHIYNRGLPKTAPQLFGREEQLALLLDAWQSDKTRILSVVAPGGVGKSALVNEWLRKMRGLDYLDARRVLAWSFYSQGTQEHLVSADEFVRSALKWLGDDQPLAQSPSLQGARLAKLIREHHFLLVLDGLEPLQYPETAPDVGGQLTDASMAALLHELAKPEWEGLCLITTRVPLTGLTPPGSSAAATVAELRLNNLDDQAGADLLQSLTGPQKDALEAKQAVQEVHGHALAVNLLGRYLRDVHGGQLSGRFELRNLTSSVPNGGHARRIMEKYAEWLERDGRSGELAILDIVGLFDRPAPYAAIAAVLTDTEQVWSAPGLDEVGGAEWDRCVAKLRHMGLIGSETAGLPETLDAHPLVREHFRDRLRSRDKDLWKAGNRALYDYYARRAPTLPENASEMSLLYAAVNHGCAIGLHQEVYDKVLIPRVWRGPREAYSTRILGMTGSEVVALSNYFQMPSWTKLRKEVSLPKQARLLVMGNAALRLRQLGRLDDAQASCSTVLTAVKPSAGEPALMADAAFAASLHCELLVIAGQLQTDRGALHTATRAIEFADRCNDAYFKMYSRSCLAEVHFMVGDLDTARDRFDEAKVIAADQKVNLPFLYSQNLYRYGYFVIETGGAATLLTDAEQDPGWGLSGENSSQLSRAIKQLILGAACRSLVEQGAVGREHLSRASTQVDDAIVMFRGVGYTDYIVRGLLERAHLLRIRRRFEDYASALDDLDEALAETTRGNMKLLAADVYLQQAACHLTPWPSMPPEHQTEARAGVAATLAEADQQVSSLGYGRRYTMRRELKRQARDYGIA